MKKHIGKSLVTIVLAVILSVSLVISAFAGNFNNLADELNDLNLFRGTGVGYELERAPLKGEALVMLIRFLGLEEEALAGGYKHPYTDVPE